METGQITILTAFSIVFALCWFYSTSFTLNNMDLHKNASIFILSNVLIGFIFAMSIVLTVTITSEANELRKEKLKKHVEPKYEQVTETFYRKIN